MNQNNALNKLKEIDVKNILIVRKHNHVGDMLCSLPLFTALKKHYIEAKITLVVSPVFYKLNYKDINPYIDNIIVYNKEGLRYFIQFISQLRKFKFDIGIVPSTVKASRTSHIINFLSGAKIRAGVKKINSIKNKFSFLLNLKSDFNWTDSHQINRNIDIAKMLNCFLKDNELDVIGIKHDKDALVFAKDFMDKYFPDKTKKIIGLHTGAGEKFKKWSDNNFISLIKLLYDNFNCYFLLSCGTIDEESVNTIRNSSLLKGIEVTTLQSSFKKDAAVFSKIHLFITNNTGVMHIVHFASKNKMITITPSSLAKEWAYNSNREKYIESESIDEISVEQVFNECCKMLNE